MGYSYLEPGNELKISAHIYFSTNQVNIAELVKMTPEQLKAAEMSSIAAEKAIFAQMSEIEKKWEKQAEQTMALRKAQKYLKTPPTPHTSNKWITSEYDWHEMSNMVYKFIWRIYENQRWSQEKQTSVTTSFDLSWYLSYNTPHNPDYSGPGRQIAGQERKHFGEKADLDRYLQGRINAYAHLFTEISPPIPSAQKKRFCVNGVLLPGYTVEVTREQKVSALLELLTDDDLADCGEAADPAVPPPIPFKTKASKKSSPTRDHKKKHVPTR